MASTEERLRKLVDDNLVVEGRPAGRPLNLEASFTEAGVSSVDLVAFTRVVSQEFNVTITPEDCPNFRTAGDLISFIDSRTG